MATLRAYPKYLCGHMDLCTCQVKDKIEEFETQGKLIQFLMGLNEAYKGVRNQILTMEPLPNVNRAFT